MPELRHFGHFHCLCIGLTVESAIRYSGFCRFPGVDRIAGRVLLHQIPGTENDPEGWK